MMKIGAAATGWCAERFSPHLGLCPQTAGPKPECFNEFQRLAKDGHRFFSPGFATGKCSFLCALTCVENVHLGARTIPLCCMCPAKLFGSIFLLTRKIRKWKIKTKFRKWKIKMCWSVTHTHSATANFHQKLEGFKRIQTHDDWVRLMVWHTVWHTVWYTVSLSDSTNSWSRRVLKAAALDIDRPAPWEQDLRRLQRHETGWETGWNWNETLQLWFLYVSVVSSFYFLF